MTQLEETAVRAAIDALRNAGRATMDDVPDDDHTFVMKTVDYKGPDHSYDVFLFVRSAQGNFNATVRVIIPNQNFGKPRQVDAVTISVGLRYPAVESRRLIAELAIAA
ncbi:MAG: hypothetical protein Q7R47_05270 [Candidatus Diapherotrites archaeon]|nr:hypothetical protein [Candidatus Diapherotrites archaeon]